MRAKQRFRVRRRDHGGRRTRIDENKSRDRFGIFQRIGLRDKAAIGMAEHGPLLDREVHPQRLEIVDHFVEREIGVEDRRGSSIAAEIGVDELEIRLQRIEPGLKIAVIEAEPAMNHQQRRPGALGFHKQTRAGREVDDAIFGKRALRRDEQHDGAGDQSGERGHSQEIHAVFRQTAGARHRGGKAKMLARPD